MRIDLTMLSRDALDVIKNRDMLPKDAFSYLSQDIIIRTFSEVIGFYSKSRDLQSLLISEFCKYDPLVKRESVMRKVRDWLNDKYEPSDREDYFKICFALQLNEQAAQSFLCLSTDSGIHYRNPKELVFAYSFRTGLSYIEAMELYRSLPTLPVTYEHKSIATSIVINEFQTVYDEESFKAFYYKNMDVLGVLHNTAYEKFQRFFDKLRLPSSSEFVEAKDEPYTVDEILMEYFRVNLPYNRETNAYTTLQKTVKKYWPNSTSIKNMINRKCDVSRKVILLMYLIFQGNCEGESEDDCMDNELTPNEMLTEHYVKLNVRLMECGFSRLDPRCVFDWLILYCLKTDADGDMKERLDAVLAKIFGDVEDSDG